MKTRYKKILKKMQGISSTQWLNIAIVVFGILCIYPRREGYFFLLDFVPIPGDVYSDRIFWYTGLLPVITFMIGDLLGSMVLQYIIYLGALLILGFGAKRVLLQLGMSRWGLWFGVLFAMCNPFIYTRMMEGHANVFLGYGLLFVAMSYMIGHIISPDLSPKRKRIYICCAGLGLSYFPHSVFFILLLTTAVFLLEGTLFSKIKNYIVLIGAIFLLNINRILAGFLTVGQSAVTMTQFDDNHIRVFSSTSPDANIPLHLISLHGFWGESMGRFANNFVINDRWHLMFGVIALCILTGIYVGVKGVYISSSLDTKISKIPKISVWLVCVGGIAYILSMGTSGRGWVASLTAWMYDHIPFYTGLREPQKRTGILLFCYVVFGAIGIQYIVDMIHKKSGGDVFWERLVGGVFVILPLLYTPYMLFAMGGQLGVYTYPDEWYESKEYLHAGVDTSVGNQSDCMTDACYDTLIFPRHQYIRLSRARNVTAHPIERFLKHSDAGSLAVLAGDNMEMIDIYTQSQRPASKIIEAYIGPGGLWWKGLDQSEDGDMLKDHYDQFIQDINLLGIQYIVLLKEAQREPYHIYIEDMRDQGYVDMGLENDHVIVYSIASVEGF